MSHPKDPDIRYIESLIASGRHVIVSSAHLHYSVGVPELWGFPELVISGISQKAATLMISEVLMALKLSGHESVRDGVLIGGILLQNDLALKQVPAFRGAQHFPKIRARLRSEIDFDVYQIVLPDLKGYLPWEPEYDAEHMVSQKMLWTSALH